MKDPEMTKKEMTKEELSAKIEQLEQELEKSQSELRILKSNEVFLKDTIIRLAMKTVGIIQ